MPICMSPSIQRIALYRHANENATVRDDLTFRCQHFNVLDDCFREKSLICLPNAIGQTAKSAYRRKIFECARTQQMAIQHHKRHKNLQGRKSTVALLNARSAGGMMPSELQFISLFGYLQTQCRRGGAPAETRGERAPPPAVAPAELAPESNPPPHSFGPAGADCSSAEMAQLLASCESAVREQRDNLMAPHVDLNRHQLLRIKLDASSKLLEHAETNREHECLMVRSVLSDIFLIHQKYCLQTSVTRCICQQLNFAALCDINCQNLEAMGLPLEQRISWTADFRGRLIENRAVPLRVPNLPAVFVVVFNVLMLVVI